MPHAAHDSPDASPVSPVPSAPSAPPAPAAPFGLPDGTVVAALAARAALAFAPSAPPPGAAPAAGLLSPCIGVCRLDALRHHCEGCLRTLDEIRAWARSDDTARRAIWAAVAGRAGIALPEPDGAAPAAGASVASPAVP